MSLDKHVFIDCMNYAPVICKSDGSEGDGADNTVALVAAGPHTLEMRYEQANSDIIPVRVVDSACCNGWQVPNDATDDEGVEMGFGILADTNAKHAFTIGTDPAFFFAVKFGIPKVADYDFAGIGFRKAAAYGDALNDEGANWGTAVVYTDFAAIYNDNGAINTTGAVNQTGGGTGTATITDSTSTWANDATKELKVKVSAAGVVTFEIAGTAVATYTATTFDTGDVVIPFMYFCKDANGSDSPPIIEYIALGYQ